RQRLYVRSHHRLNIQNARVCTPSSLTLSSPPPPSTHFPYTTLFRSVCSPDRPCLRLLLNERWNNPHDGTSSAGTSTIIRSINVRSEDHTSELQSRFDLVCRLLLEKKKNKPIHCIVAAMLWYFKPATC